MSDEKMSDKIKDMSLNDEDKDKDKDDFTIEGMSLGMELDGPDSVHVGQRIKKLFPDVDVIDLSDDLKITNMASGSYTVKGMQLKELASIDLKKIDDFLKAEEAKK